MVKNQSKELMVEREYYLTELMAWIGNISKFEQNNNYLKKLIKKSKKRNKKAINDMIKRKIKSKEN